MNMCGRLGFRREERIESYSGADDTMIHVLELVGEDIPIAVVDTKRPTVRETYKFSTPELLIAFGDYGLFDDDCYAIMSADVVRNWHYSQAVRRLTAGCCVLDLGAGRDMNWTLASLQSGARHVYAIESREEAYDSGLALIHAMGLTNRVTLIHGLSTEVSLPERVDVCVSEIIGCIGSSEGVRHVLADAKSRFLRTDGIMIPDQCRTLMSPVTLPSPLHRAPAVPSWMTPFIEKCFRDLGRGGDIRFGVRNLDATLILSTPVVFEEIRFNDVINSTSSQKYEIPIARSGRLDGFALWVELFCDCNQRPISTLEDPTNWTPTFFPVFYPGVQVNPGDVITVECLVEYSAEGTRLPDYRVRGRLNTEGGPINFDYVSASRERKFRHCEFYQRLFPVGSEC